MSVVTVRRRAVLAFGIVLALTSAIAVLLVREPIEAGPKPPAYAELACAPGELKGVNHRDLNPLTPGSTSPDVALQTYLSAEMPKMSLSALGPVTLGPESAQYAYREGGKPLAYFDVVNLGVGWRFSGWSACESFVAEYLQVKS